MTVENVAILTLPQDYRLKLLPFNRCSKTVITQCAPPNRQVWLPESKLPSTHPSITRSEAPILRTQSRYCLSLLKTQSPSCSLVVPEPLIDVHI